MIDMELTPAEQQRLMEALRNPPVPSTKAREAVERYRQIVKTQEATMSRTIQLTPREAMLVGSGRRTMTLTDKEADGLFRLTEKMLNEHTDPQDQAHQAVWQSLRDRLADAKQEPEETPP